MPTNKPRVTITISGEQLARIEKYRFEHKFKNQTQAILSLIEDGFNFVSAYSSDADNLIHSDFEKKYNKLDERGKDVVNAIIDKEHIYSSSKRI